MTRTKRAVGAMVAVVLLFAVTVSGCAPTTAPDAENPTEPEVKAEPVAIKIGTLATSDALPLWAAEQAGYFTDEGIPGVEIVVFQSAQERETAFAAGAIHASMTDIMQAANLQAGGVPVKLPTVMLGAEPGQGRFAIVAAPNSGITSLAELKGVPVGTASSTITEYLLDKLMAEAGVDQADVKVEEIKKVPVRYELMMAGQVKAAVLPEPLVSLALLNGATIPEGGNDLESAQNLSESVLAVDGEFLETDEGAATIDALLLAWDRAVTDINADPDSFRQILVEKANLPAPLAETFEVDTYPMAAPPKAQDIQNVLDWMKAKGYLQAEVTPADLLP